MVKYIPIILFCLFSGDSAHEKCTDKLPYLALGDSYTIGESVSREQSFPYQLSNKLSALGVSPTIIAKTGWTTDELLSAVEREKPTHDYAFVTLLIGVNNQYRGYSTVQYRREFQELVLKSIEYAGGRAKRVFVISIPDWGVTDYATKNGFNSQSVSKQIDEFNAINKEESKNLGVNYLDITEQSRRARTDKTLIASDGLHPSGKMYEGWANALYPFVKKVLE